MTENNITYNYKNKTVLVCGGSRGIGAGVVDAFIESGAKVFYCSRNPINSSNSDKAIHIKSDLKNELEIKKIFEIMKDNGGVDILINSAAINFTKKIEEINLEEWDKVLDLNLRSVFHICKLAFEQMKKNKNGKIVNISSIAGRHRSIVSGVHYVASKSGLIGLTKQLAYEAARYNINVNAVCPSQTLTEMLSNSMNSKELKELSRNIPIKRVAQISDQVGPILFLCSKEASYITGTFIDVNGGQI